ncbi:MAG TPA: hypothetical protein VKR61_15885 [Bryobacteraceae bacterium]|nr:hypothetical protein [Bryobacteraceae bacterium]
MNTFALVAAVPVLVVLLLVFGRTFAQIYLKFRGPRVITCPENHRPAGVTVDARHLWFTTLEDKPVLRLKTCSRWPEFQNCGQECLSQIEAAPEDCLVRQIVTNWYHGKNCAVCGKPIGELDWVGHQPALLNPDHRTIQWLDVPAGNIPDVLATHQPVCWNCHVVNRMMTQHPELVTDRSRHA